MIKTDRVIIVEGKYDKITLENVVEATVISTNGFGIFKDKQKRELIRRLAEEKGIAVLTDSDRAGAQIRSFIKNICGGSNILNVYIPQLKGKEKRKAKAGKDGFLGVEGMSEEILLDSLLKAGITAEKTDKKSRKITKQDLFTFGLSGRNCSAAAREDLARFLALPSKMSSSAFLDAINALYGYEEFERQVSLWRREADRK